MPMLKETLQDKTKQLAAFHEALADIVGRWTVGQEDCPTAIPNLSLFRRESPNRPSACTVEPSVVVVVQGAKQLIIGKRAYTYDTEHFLINSLDLPANSQALEASKDKPCLGLVLRLDLGLIADMIVQFNLMPPRGRAVEGCSALGRISPVLLEPFSRLLALLDEPSAIPALASLIEREIYYRLLVSDQAARLWEIASVGSMSHRIANVVRSLRENYDQQLRLDELAANAQMSTSSLHHHFRQLTAMSPLQYQKRIRLHEARNLMLNERLDAASAAFQVGYESASQFSREYSRQFGAPPKRDIETLRQRAMR